MEQSPETVQKNIRGRLIVVDDDDAMLTNLQKILSFYGFLVMPFNSAENALEKAISDKNSFDAILTDFNMPGMNGIEFIERLRQTDPEAVAVFLTGYPSAENAISALRAGAFDFLEKPFSNEHLAITLDKAVELKQLRRKVENYRCHLEEMLQERTRELRSTLRKLENAYMTTMEVIVALLEAREPSTASHSKRVSDRTVFLSRKMGISEEKELEAISKGALLHDIGKIGIPDNILKKPGKLSPEEMEIMRSHAEIGYKIISTIPDMEAAAEIVYSHHERFDGKGYPKGLKGENISLAARIFSVIDTYDAIRFDRCYHKGTSMKEALAEIEKASGIQFDPYVVKCFKENINEIDRI